MDKIIVNQHEKHFLDLMEDGKAYKLRELSEKTGFNYTTTSMYLKMFRELGWVNYDYRVNTYTIVPGNTYVVPSVKTEEKVLTKRPLEPTYIRREGVKVQSEVTVTHWTKEQMEEHEKRITSRHRFIEYKQGVLRLNENYGYAEDSR